MTVATKSRRRERAPRPGDPLEKLYQHGAVDQRVDSDLDRRVRERVAERPKELERKSPREAQPKTRSRLSSKPDSF